MLATRTMMNDPRKSWEINPFSKDLFILVIYLTDRYYSYSYQYRIDDNKIVKQTEILLSRFPYSVKTTFCSDVKHISLLVHWIKN